MWGDTGDVFTHGVDHGLDVTRLVGGKPFAVVVFFQVIKKTEKILIETAKFNSDTGRDDRSQKTGSANSTEGTGRGCKNRVVGVWATGS